MPIIEPVVTAEKLRALLAEQTESESLDFKSQCDLNDNYAKVEFAKDVAAMMAFGGYLVIGADDHGKPVDWPAEQQAPLFDEATLRQKMETYIQGPFTILSATHALDGHTYVVVYVAPHPDGFAVFKQTGYHTKRAQDDPKPAFRAGQVYVRRGTSSIPLSQADIPRMLRRRDNEIRDAIREDFAQTNAAIERARGALGIAGGPIAGITWQLDEETFTSVTLELIRRNDRIPLQSALLEAAADAANAVASGDEDTLNTILDRITTVAAAAITYDDTDAFQRALKALASVYRTGFERGVTRTTAGAVFPPQLWLAVIGRVEALGALAVRFERWDFVRQLADQPPHGRGSTWFRSWLRHASVEASRANILGRESDRGLGNLIRIARNHINHLPVLRPDYPDDSSHDAASTTQAGDDALLTSACQFDALWCIVVQANSDKPDRTSDFFTDFAYYDEHRTLPIIDQLVTDTGFREALLPNTDDQTLASTLTSVLHMANTRESWYDFDPSPAVQAFIDAAGGQ
jgi:hypothetical protein